MPADASALMPFMRAIAEGHTDLVLRSLAAQNSLASELLRQGATRQNPTLIYFDEISHCVYAGDTALHVAAAGNRQEVVRALIAAGADISMRNRRGAQPLHYAADGVPGGPAWNPQAQAATIADLIEAGADPNSIDRSGVTALHRAVRTRCAAAVGALLDGGADPRRVNKSGSTPLSLAFRSTGRGGSGSPEAKAEQAEIIRLLELSL